MATFIPFVDCVQSNIQYTATAIPCEMVMGFRWLGGGPMTLSDMASLNTVIVTNLLTPLKSHVNSGIVFRNVHTVDLDSVTGFVQDDPITLAGTATGQSMPNQVAMTITFLTNLRGRSYRGRNFLCGLMAADAASDTQWGATVLAAILLVYQNFDLALPAVNWEQVVLSRQNGNVPRVTGHAENVVGYRTNPQIYTQRRRLR